MFFESWYGMLRTLLAGILAYTWLLLVLRITGKRTLSKLNAFDLIVTVALGSTLSSVLVSRSVPLAEGMLALALLVSLQYAVTWSSVRSKRFSDMVKAQPTLLFYRGDFQEHAMRRERVTREEILSAMRAAGESEFRQVEAVILETGGDLNVITRAQDGNADTLESVKGPHNS